MQQSFIVYFCAHVPLIPLKIKFSCFQPKSYEFRCCHLCQYCLLFSITPFGRSSTTKMTMMC